MPFSKERYGFLPDHACVTSNAGHYVINGQFFWLADCLVHGNLIYSQSIHLDINLSNTDRNSSLFNWRNRAQFSTKYESAFSCKKIVSCCRVVIIEFVSFFCNRLKLMITHSLITWVIYASPREWHFTVQQCSEWLSRCWRGVNSVTL